MKRQGWKISEFVIASICIVTLISACGGDGGSNIAGSTSGSGIGTVSDPGSNKVVHAVVSNTSKAKVFLGAGDDIFTASNNGITVYGNSGNDAVTIASGVTGVTLDQNIESISFSGASSSYTYKQSGNVINVYDSTGASLIAKSTVQDDSNGTVLTFDSLPASAMLAGGVMTLGGKIVSSTAAGGLTDAPITTTTISAPTTTTLAPTTTTASVTTTTLAPAAACGSCHAIPPATGQHAFHTNKRIGCVTCHGSGYSSTTVNTATHNNGNVDLSSSIGWNATSSSCSNSCHGSNAW